MVETLVIAVFGVFAAALLRGFTGFGFGLAAVPLLSLALAPARVVPLVVVLQVIVGVGGLRSAWRLCDWRAVRALSPGLVLGTPIGVAMLTTLRCASRKKRLTSSAACPDRRPSATAISFESSRALTFICTVSITRP